MRGRPHEPLVDARSDWIRFAACRGHGTAAFFVGVGERTAQARALCETCPAMPGCRDYAVVNGIEHGVWGDTTPDDRRSLKHTRPPVSEGVPRVVWMRDHGWTRPEIAAEFGVSVRTIERYLSKERSGR